MTGGGASGKRRRWARALRHLELQRDDDMKVWRVLVIVWAVVLVGGWLAVESRGCRPPPDEVFIANALDRYFETFLAGDTRVYTDNSSGEIDVVPYRDADELRALNPECCTVVDPFAWPGYHQSRFQIIRYGLHAQVEIVYRPKVPADTGFRLSSPEDTITFSVWMTSCGTVSDYDYVKYG